MERNGNKKFTEKLVGWFCRSWGPSPWEGMHPTPVTRQSIVKVVFSILILIGIVGCVFPEASDKYKVTYASADNSSVKVTIGFKAVLPSPTIQMQLTPSGFQLKGGFGVKQKADHYSDFADSYQFFVKPSSISRSYPATCDLKSGKSGLAECTFNMGEERFKKMICEQRTLQITAIKHTKSVATVASLQLVSGMSSPSLLPRKVFSPQISLVHAEPSVDCSEDQGAIVASGENPEQTNEQQQVADNSTKSVSESGGEESPVVAEAAAPAADPVNPDTGGCTSLVGKRGSDSTIWYLLGVMVWLVLRRRSKMAVLCVGLLMLSGCFPTPDKIGLRHEVNGDNVKLFFTFPTAVPRQSIKGIYYDHIYAATNIASATLGRNTKILGVNTMLKSSPSIGPVAAAHKLHYYAKDALGNRYDTQCILLNEETGSIRDSFASISAVNAKCTVTIPKSSFEELYCSQKGWLKLGIKGGFTVQYNIDQKEFFGKDIVSKRISLHKISEEQAGVVCDPSAANPDPNTECGPGEIKDETTGECTSGPVDEPVADADHDGFADGVDNCPSTANADQANADGDEFGDACDATPGTNPSPNPNEDPPADPDPCAGESPDPAQCDAVDQDGVPSASDNCPNVANPGQEDVDADGSGDACDQCPNISTDIVIQAANDNNVQSGGFFPQYFQGCPAGLKATEGTDATAEWLAQSGQSAEGAGSSGCFQLASAGATSSAGFLLPLLSGVLVLVASRRRKN